MYGRNSMHLFFCDFNLRYIMAANKGKKFERQFKESAENDGLFVLRLNDTDLSFNGNEHSRFTLKNPYDFLIYNYPNIFCLELKSSCYSSIGIQRSPKEPEKMIILNKKTDVYYSGTEKRIYFYDFTQANIIIDLMMFYRDANETDFNTFRQMAPPAGSSLLALLQSTSRQNWLQSTFSRAAMEQASPSTTVSPFWLTAVAFITMRPGLNLTVPSGLVTSSPFRITSKVAVMVSPT